ncbi:MAG: RtcB family protein [Armatimonadota bacterium]
MIRKQDFHKVADYVYEIPASFREGMRVPARMYADEKILEAALQDKAAEQLVNTTTLPGVTKYALAMPDVHQGYGPPIGGVIPVDEATGVISPGATGYDINCGVRLLRSDLTASEVLPFMQELVDALFRYVPSGVGKGGDIRLKTDSDMNDLLTRGALWAIERGYGVPEDAELTEEGGSMPGADPGKVSPEAKKRGDDQVGTLGSGNHFLEVGRVDEIFDETVAKAFGLFHGQFVVWVHSGSRGMGHQVCTDYVKSFQSAMKKYDIHVPDRELVCAPFTSPEGQAYFGAMVCAANYAWANRQVLANRARQAVYQVLANHNLSTELRMVYDVAHNIVKRETYEIDGKPVPMIIHRKGATRAFGPGQASVPERYRAIGQPVLVPGDMGTASHVLVGTEGAMEQTFGSACHGAGRAMSRSAAIKQLRGQDLQARLKRQGIVVKGGSWEGLAEEAPEAYKDVDRVVNVIHQAGIARKVARTVPLGVIKG